MPCHYSCIQCTDGKKWRILFYYQIIKGDQIHALHVPLNFKELLVQLIILVHAIYVTLIIINLCVQNVIIAA